LNNALAWAAKDLFANVGLVGKENGLWALDDDAGMLAIMSEFGPVNTYTTITPSGGRHLIFRQSAASWAMGNVNVTDENKSELMSARVNDRYVVLAGSWGFPHNDTSKQLMQYTAVDSKAPVSRHLKPCCSLFKTRRQSGMPRFVRRNTLLHLPHRPK